MVESAERDALFRLVEPLGAILLHISPHKDGPVRDEATGKMESSLYICCAFAAAAEGGIGRSPDVEI